jgi:hypothetical protein
MLDTSNIEYKEQFTTQKLKITGSIVQLSKFAKQFHIGKWQYHKLKKVKDEFDIDIELPEESQDEIRVKSLRRAKTKLTDYINSNVYQYSNKKGKTFPAVFLTLTFEKNETDIILANDEFTKFIQRLNYSIIGQKEAYAKYVCVIEFQKRGAVHYHIIFFNIPFITKIKMAEIWGNGLIKIKAVNDVKDIGRYVTKYMVKDNDDPRLQKRKSYFVSDGLIQPTVVYVEELVNEVRRMLPADCKEVDKTDIPAGFLQYMDFQRYNLINHSEVSEKIKEFLDPYI